MAHKEQKDLAVDKPRTYGGAVSKKRKTVDRQLTKDGVKLQSSNVSRQSGFISGVLSMSFLGEGIFAPYVG
jgi:hypothetical protein